MEQYFKAILEAIEPNYNREELKPTPARAAQAFQFLTKGYQVNLESIFSQSLFPSSQTDLIVVKNIEFYSTCEHHLLPFFGKCHIAYIPDGYLLGLSKFAEVVDAFSHRLQIQENLCEQIAKSIQHYLKPKGLAVILEAQHLCMMMRGIQKQHASLYTQKLMGDLKHPEHQQMLFLQLAHQSVP
jgi:GTP cyclohydrolase I